MTELCPLHCVNIGCPSPSFLDKNQTFLLTIIGIGSSALTMLFAYFLKSRCKKVNCCYGLLICDRNPIDLTIPVDVTVENSVA
jgi:hypothetical protein